MYLYELDALDDGLFLTMGGVFCLSVWFWFCRLVMHRGGGVFSFREDVRPVETRKVFPLCVYECVFSDVEGGALSMMINVSMHVIVY